MFWLSKNIQSFIFEIIHTLKAYYKFLALIS